MDIVYRRGRASVADVLNDLENPPSYSAVRSMMRILEEKGHLRHDKEGARYIYTPILPRQNAGESALKQVFQTFFDNSIEKTIAALLNVSDTALSDEEIRSVGGTHRTGQERRRKAVTQTVDSTNFTEAYPLRRKTS